MNIALTLLCVALFHPEAEAAPQGFFAIEVVDATSGRGVPLVELTTVEGIRFVTDNAGLIAIDDPDLMDQLVYFHIKSHGYAFPKDGFGFQGKAVKVVPGGRTKLSLPRVNIAERLYRVTGGGLYRDTVALGITPPVKEPLINAKVLGSDSVLSTVYQGKIHWFWGDTNRPDYPLGNFHVPGATSLLPADGGLDPSIGVDLTYLVDESTGFARPTAKLPGDGPTWLDGLITFVDDTKREHMFAFYAKIRPPLDAYERGLAEWNDRTKEFLRVAVFPKNGPVNAGGLPNGGHPFIHADQGIRYIYYANPYPLTRVRAEPDALKDPANFERFTCLEPTAEADKTEVTRDAMGKVVYAWKKGAAGVGPTEQAALIKAGKLKPNEALLQLRDVETGKTIQAHGGSVAWNEYRQRWVMITVESGGSTSYLGEVWYAEADQPIGPWTYARKVLTHDKYSFYNPKHHPFFDQNQGRLIYFEGTYTNTFSGTSDRTPRYDYNQVMYRLDLTDSQVNLPIALYLSASGKGRHYRFATLNYRSNPPLPIPFFALDQPGQGTIPIFPDQDFQEKRVPWFHVLAPNVVMASEMVVPLYKYVDQQEQTNGFYSVDPAWSQKDDGFKRVEQPIGLVWKNPRL